MTSSINIRGMQKLRPFLEGAVAVDPVRQDTEMVHEECGPLSACDVLPIDVSAGLIEAALSSWEKDRECISVHFTLEKERAGVSTSSGNMKEI